jgi:AcrR family transcriptional regulator
MNTDDKELGKRERNKRETHAMLVDAAERLIAERGYDRTTVRDIAEAAGVAERTFFRYFASKEELVLDETLISVDHLAAIIRARPADESAIEAVGAAVAVMEAELRVSSRPNLLHLFADSRPAESIRRVGRRAMPGRVLAIEEALIAPIAERLRMDGHPDDGMLVLRAEALARIIVATVRAVLLRDLEWRREGTDHPAISDTLAAVFADLAAGWPRP